MPLPTETRSLTELPVLTSPDVFADLLLVHDADELATKTISLAKVRGVFFAPIAPSIINDSAAGVLAGAFWIQQAPGDGGPTPVTLWQCLDPAAGAARWVVVRNPRELMISPVVTSSQILTPGYQIYEVDTTLTALELTLPDPGLVGKVDFGIKKINSTGNGIVLIPHDPAVSIEVGEPGENIDLPGSYSASTGYWYVYAANATTWRLAK